MCGEDGGVDEAGDRGENVCACMGPGAGARWEGVGGWSACGRVLAGGWNQCGFAVESGGRNVQK